MSSEGENTVWKTWISQNLLKSVALYLQDNSMKYFCLTEEG